MSRPARELETEPASTGHLIGRHRGTSSGPLLVGVGGLHGNEPSGVRALKRVFERLEEHRPPFRGDLVGLRGNRTALSRGRRFIDEDLNRIWTMDRIATLRPGEEPPSPGGRDPGPDGAESSRFPGGETIGRSVESAEQAELLSLIHATLEEGPADAGEVRFLDLHTTSSESAPFLTFSDSLRNRDFARHYPVPLVLGVEEELQGTLRDYVDHLGYTAVGVEGGSHTHPTSVDRLEAAVWLGLLTGGHLELEHVPRGDGLRDRLVAAARGIPRLFEVRYRHRLRSGDDFRMKPGYRNFQRVEAGELVARDRRGEIVAPESGRIFLPLYQEQGEEGFFIVREVHPFWMKLSAWLRRLGLDAVVRWLPAVKPHPEREETLVVEPRAARPLVVKLFHLLGYRRERSEDGRLVVSRRKESPGPRPTAP